MPKKRTLLVVDDSMVARMFIQKYFEDNPDWEIIEAEKSEQALEILKIRSCDAISIDYNMPGGNGMELIDFIIKNYPSIKIAMLTANIQDSLRIEAEKKGVVFLEKPITAKTIERLKQL